MSCPIVVATGTYGADAAGHKGHPLRGLILATGNDHAAEVQMRRYFDVEIQGRRTRIVRRSPGLGSPVPLGHVAGDIDGSPSFLQRAQFRQRVVDSGLGQDRIADQAVRARGCRTPPGKCCSPAPAPGNNPCRARSCCAGTAAHKPADRALRRRSRRGPVRAGAERSRRCRGAASRRESDRIPPARRQIRCSASRSRGWRCFRAPTRPCARLRCRPRGGPAWEHGSLYFAGTYLAQSIGTSMCPSAEITLYLRIARAS